MSEDKLSVKQSGIALFYDNKKVKLEINGKQLPGVRSMDIAFRLEEVTKATVEIIDFDLDLKDIDVEINVDELKARILLLNIYNTLHEKGQTDEGFVYDIVDRGFIDDILEMTKGMPGHVDMTTRDSNGFRQRVKTNKEDNK